jgi:DNA-binding LacI/PurR family transcriptional regulator
LAQACSNTGIPAAFLDMLGQNTPALSGTASQRARIFTVAETGQCGRKMGAYLCGLGHRRVAVLADAPLDPPWARRRVDGIAHAFAMAGAHEPVVFALDDPGSVRDMVLSSAEMEALRRHRREFPEPPNLSAKRAANLFYTENAQEYLRTVHYRDMLAPLFTTVLADPSFTAWVCLRDLIAVLAMEFLKEHNVAVPQGLSVVGFDDSAEARELWLTSYNFNLRGTALAMLEFLLSPRTFAARGLPLSVEVPGMVIQRDSVRAVAGTSA